MLELIPGHLYELRGLMGAGVLVLNDRNYLEQANTFPLSKGEIITFLFKAEHDSSRQLQAQMPVFLYQDKKIWLDYQSRIHIFIKKLTY